MRKKRLIGVSLLTVGLIGALLGIYIWLQTADKTVTPSFEKSDSTTWLSSNKINPIKWDKTWANYKKKLKKTYGDKSSELSRELLEAKKQLNQIGWSDTSIYHGFITKISLKSDSTSYTKRLAKRLAASKKVASSSFDALLESEMALMNAQKDKVSAFSSQKRRGRHLLELVLNTVDMPLELSGSKDETLQLIKRFDNDLEPDDAFWSAFALWVQYAFPKNSLSHKSDFQQKIHQFRYVISAQQAYYIRKHYGRANQTDRDALIAYMKEMDDYNAFLDEMGVEDADVYYDYSTGESSRLHNKIALKQTLGQTQIIYPDGKEQVNIKIVMDFHTEFILDSQGHFLNEIDEEGASENGIVNGASFNYANRNDRLHVALDVKPIRPLDPQFRKAIVKPFKAPNRVSSPQKQTMLKSWSDSYFNAKGYYGINHQSRAKAVKKALKQLVKEVTGGKK